MLKHIKNTSIFHDITRQLLALQEEMLPLVHEGLMIDSSDEEAWERYRREELFSSYIERVLSPSPFEWEEQMLA